MKTDKQLGKQVRAHLEALGVETPMLKELDSSAENIKDIEQLFAQIMNKLGLDLKDDSLADTPKRVAKMFTKELFYGLSYDNFPKCTAVANKMSYDEMVTVDKINVSSSCEHHFVIIDGVARVSYIPGAKVIGLSKINRIVDFFSKRPQIQERLTNQIFHALSYILGTQDIAVMVKATHYCVKARGVKDINSVTTTTKLGGVYKTEPTTRQEFLNI